MKLLKKPLAEPVLVRFRRHIQGALDEVEEAGKLIDDDAIECYRDQMFGVLDEVSDRIEALKYLLDKESC